MHGLSLVAESEGATLHCGTQASHCSGFSYYGTQALGTWVSVIAWTQWLQHVDSVVAAHGLSCSMACEIFPDQGLNPCPLPWQAYSYLLYH